MVNRENNLKHIVNYFEQKISGFRVDNCKDIVNYFEHRIDGIYGESTLEMGCESYRL